MLLIDNATVAQVLSMEDCIAAQDASFRRMITGLAVHRPRIDVYAPTGRSDDYYRWGSMEGADAELGVFAIRMKSDIVRWPMGEDQHWTEDKYCQQPGTYCGLIWLFSIRTGEPLAIILDGHLQHFRVGGGAGLGVRYLARPDAAQVGVIGSGGMARTYLTAICCERPIAQVAVFSPNRMHREAFARDMAQSLGVKVTAVPTPEEAVSNAEIVATCTDSMEPVLRAEWLRPGTHVTNLGPMELGDDVYARADVVIRQGEGGLTMPDTSRVSRDRGHSPVAYMAGTPEDLSRIPQAPAHATMFGRTAPSLTDLLQGRAGGRRSTEDITVYINVGNQGLQFAAVGAWVYQQVQVQGLGQTLPTEWFLQNIRD